MQIKERIEENIPVVAIIGDIDLGTSPELRAVLKAKAAQRTTQLLLDFTQVAYIDSSGISTLIEYYQSLQDLGGKLALASLTPRVLNVIELVSLQHILPIYPDVPSALVALKKLG